jgi:hypothetical protein
MNDDAVAHEVALLQGKIVELGARGADGRFAVRFGTLFDATVDVFEALGGTRNNAPERHRTRCCSGMPVRYDVSI